MAALGLRFCARAFSSCGKRGPLFIAVRGPLTIAASLAAEHRLQMRRLSNCGSRAELLRGMWDLPRPGLEPVSPAWAGRFSTTVPPGKPWEHDLRTTALLHIEHVVALPFLEYIQRRQPGPFHDSAMCHLMLNWRNMPFGNFYSLGPALSLEDLQKVSHSL